MDSIKQVALGKALAFLRAANAQAFIIRDEDGQQMATNHTAIDYSQYVPAPAAAAEPIRRTNNFVKTTGYLERVKATAIGGEVIFNRGEHTDMSAPDWNSFMSSLHSAVKRHWGDFAHERKDGSVKYLRVA